LAEKSIERYFKAGNLIVALRDEDDLKSLELSLVSLPSKPKEITIISTPNKAISSSKIRQALRDNTAANGLLPSVYRYVKNQWLYVSVNKG